MKNSKRKCPYCDGHGYTCDRASGFEIVDCDMCSGEGEIPDSVSLELDGIVKDATKPKEPS